MNDGIGPSLCSLAYVSVDTIAGVVTVLGRGSLLAKVDIKSAYLLIRCIQRITRFWELSVEAVASVMECYCLVFDRLRKCLQLLWTPSSSAFGEK